LDGLERLLYFGGGDTVSGDVNLGLEGHKISPNTAPSVPRRGAPVSGDPGTGYRHRPPRHGRVADTIKNKQPETHAFLQVSGESEESVKRTVKPSRKLHWFESSTRHHLRKHRLTGTNAEIV
jgi:hypothetical protein